MDHPRTLNFTLADGLFIERKWIGACVIMSDYREVNQSLLWDIVAVKVHTLEFRVFADHRCAVRDLSRCIESLWIELGEQRPRSSSPRLQQSPGRIHRSRHRKKRHSYRCCTTSHRRANLQRLYTQEIGFFRY